MGAEFEQATRAVEAAIAAGASYADARVVQTRSRALAARNGRVEAVDDATVLGVGVRALVGSSWGFAATSDLDADAAGRTGARATATARASAIVPGGDLRLADLPASVASWQTPFDQDPFEVSLSTQADLVAGVTQTMADVDGIAVATANLALGDVRKWFVSSEGHRIDQRLVSAGGGMSAMAIGESETQVRSYPQSFGDHRSGGWEVIESFDLPGNAPRVAEEAVALLSAPPCPAGTKDIVLSSDQMALQIHESVGHAIELDRILGWEAAFAGTSFLQLDQLGSLRYGSELMNITADATLPGALGTFGFDDEGTPAQSVDIVREGTWVGVLSGRDSAHLAGLPPGGMVRADGYARLPMVRMTNVGLEPGTASLEELLDGIDDGLYLATNRSWSIDDQRLNFQFGCEIAWEVKGGKLGRMLRNPTYTGITPRFWASLDGLGSQELWRPWGIPNCGKGQPMQTMKTAHPAVPARFRGVEVGVTG